MKKKLMPLAVTAAIAAATSAQAQMMINNGGTGEILVFPFYSAEDGNTTNINITNTMAETETSTGAKAVKVRIIEGENSQEVLDFNVYMSAEDHFSFAITATADGGGALITNDNTCTVPQIAAGTPVPFRNFKYLGDKAKDDPKTEDKDESFDNTGIARTAVGYVEVIEMGQISDLATDLDPDDDDETKTSMVAAITHGADGVPANCALPVAAWSGPTGPWYAQVAADESGATTASKFMESSWMGGGLYGEAVVINVNDAMAIGYDAVAIDSAVADHGNVTVTGSQLHFAPGDTNPDFNSAGIVNSATVMVDGAQTTMTFASVDDGSLQAVSALFQTSVIMNDYVTDPGISGLTDWIVTSPTKSLHISRKAAATKDVDGKDVAAVAALAPFTTGWNGQTACEYATLDSLDREESNPAPAAGSVPDFSPAPPTETPDPYDLPLCYEVNVVQFGETSAVGNESLAVGVNAELAGVDGWASIDFTYGLLSADGKATVGSHQRNLTATEGSLEGLPVTGLAVQTYANDSVNGSGNVANYAAAFAHKTETMASGL